MNKHIFRLLMSIQRIETIAKFRVAIIRMCGIEVGLKSSVGSNVHISCGALVVGDNVRIGVGTRINNTGGVEIHDWVRMGADILIETSTHKIIPTGPYRRTTGDEIYKAVIIERGCMIYARAIILPGVTIREGCVIGAGAVIDKSTEPNGLYIGHRPRSPIFTYPASPCEAAG